MGFLNKQHDYMDNFRSGEWNKASEKKRLHSLQQLENDAAKEQGRMPRKVIPDRKHEHLSYNDCGCYIDSDSNRIWINENYLTSNSSDKYWNQYEAMNTVLHEGRHAYQHDCVEGKITKHPESQETVSMWSKNRPNEIYNGPEGDSSRYLFQPVEADANDYADGKMSSYKNKFDKDPNYESYMDSVNITKQTNIDDAAKWLGTQPDEKEIKDKISKEINDDYAWNHRHIPTREEQDQAFSKLCEYGEKQYGEDWQLMRDELVSKDPEFRNLYQTAFPDYRLPPMENSKSSSAYDPNESFTQSTEKTQRGSLPNQFEQRQTGVEFENKHQSNNNGVICGQKPDGKSQDAPNTQNALKGELPNDSPSAAKSSLNGKIESASSKAAEQTVQNSIPKVNTITM